jgi:hypothetical protein
MIFSAGFSKRVVQFYQILRGHIVRYKIKCIGIIIAVFN